MVEQERALDGLAEVLDVFPFEDRQSFFSLPPDMERENQCHKRSERLGGPLQALQQIQYVRSVATLATGVHRKATPFRAADRVTWDA